jgi:hypothetical protein
MLRLILFFEKTLRKLKDKSLKLRAKKQIQKIFENPKANPEDY